MASKFIIDQSVSKEKREEIRDRVKENLDKMKPDIAQRELVYRKRQDMFEGRHHRWSNVQGQIVKEQEGHILVVINYILKFCQKVIQTLTKPPGPRIKIVSKDEANDVETTRAEAVEQAIRDVLRDNFFFNFQMKKLAVNQLRDGDFAFECKVMKEADGKKKITISPNEDMLKVVVGWDNASGTTFSFTAFMDLWSVAKIKREFDFDADPIAQNVLDQQKRGSHLNDQYGILAYQTDTGGVPSGENKVPKAKITDYWGYEVLAVKGDNVEKVRVVNLVFINDEMVQFLVTDYKEVPRVIGHSFLVAGKPWSMSFIDPLVDPQVELNDRSGEEGDLIRVGAHMKWLAVNMPDFDPDSVKPGSGQVIFIEGENADFKPLPMTISPFPSESYINRMLDHLHTLGIPKIALAAGNAPYTGKVGAIQYQPFADLIEDLRGQWEVALTQLFTMIQQYFIDFFPETHAFMRESLYDPETGEYSEGDMVIRDVEFDWDNVLPLSRSDKVIDAATLRDRNLISVHTTLEEAGFRDPQKEIKKMKKEARDKELMALLPKFQQFTPGAVGASLEARKKTIEAEEAMGETLGTLEEAARGASEPAKAPILGPSQNEGRRGVSSATGTPTGQTRTARGAVVQATQNLNAQEGI